MSYAAYAARQSANETPRDLEIRAISHVTRQLAEANKPGADKIDRVRALNGNSKLWSLLMQDLQEPTNLLPDMLKARYISLGIFAHKTSVAAMTNDKDLSNVIAINNDVLEALNLQKPATAPATGA
jgi:flagellar biosynthesis regulator FlaF